MSDQPQVTAEIPEDVSPNDLLHNITVGLRSLVETAVAAFPEVIEDTPGFAEAVIEQVLRLEEHVEGAVAFEELCAIGFNVDQDVLRLIWNRYKNIELEHWEALGEFVTTFPMNFAIPHLIYFNIPDDIDTDELAAESAEYTEHLQHWGGNLGWLSKDIEDDGDEPVEAD